MICEKCEGKDFKMSEILKLNGSILDVKVRCKNCGEEDYVEDAMEKMKGE